MEELKNITSLAGKEALLQSIFRSAPVGIGLVVDRIFKWTNERMTEITGYTSDELDGRTARMLYPTQEEFDWVGREKYSQIKKIWHWRRGHAFSAQGRFHPSCTPQFNPS